LNFAITYDLIVANIFFRKKKSHLITFSSDKHSSQIDFVLTRREERPNCMDYKVIPGECVVIQHKLLVADFYFQVCVRRDRGMEITRTRWWKLKGDVSQVFKIIVIAEGSWNEGENADNMWKKMATHIRKVAIEVFEVTRGNKREPKDIWWWNDEVQKAINEKKECYKRLHHNKSDENIQKYKEARTNAKKSVSEPRGQTYTELYRKLDTKEGENDVYKMAKLRERKTRDFHQIKCIKDETDRLLVKDEEIKNR
jgi:hypothetical protein